VNGAGYHPYRSWLAEEGDALAATLAGDPTVPVPTCPGWTLRDLAAHVGSYHRWAADLMRSASQQPRAPYDLRPDPEVPLTQWYRGCLADLLDAVDTTPSNTPMWTVTIGQTAAAWPRRQAHDLTVHRWDAEHAIGRPGPVAADRAVDFIDELFDTALPYIVPFTGRSLPTVSLAVRTDDGTYRRGVDGCTGLLRVTREPARADATLTGPAPDLLLALWGRPHRAVVTGDPAAFAAWQRVVDA
jgi:uncharacterized protein (TIGR03083 family)